MYLNPILKKSYSGSEFITAAVSDANLENDNFIILQILPIGDKLVIERIEKRKISLDDLEYIMQQQYKKK